MFRFRIFEDYLECDVPFLLFVSYQPSRSLVQDSSTHRLMAQEGTEWRVGGLKGDGEGVNANLAWECICLLQ